MPEYLGSSFKNQPCNACGALRGPRSIDDNQGLEWALCENCWSAFRRFAERALDAKGQYTNEDLNAWLARKLFLDVRRLEKTGIVGRCEAVSDWMYGRRGAQCGLPAIIKTADGHLLCGQHLRSPRHVIEFVDGPNSNSPYEMLGRIISRLVKRDARMLETITAAIGLDAQPWSRFPHKGGKGSTPIDLMGHIFGKLTVFERVDNRVGKGRHRYWKCRCQCGVEKEIRADALLNGYYLSCGCHRKDASRERATKQMKEGVGMWAGAGGEKQASGE